MAEDLTPEQMAARDEVHDTMQRLAPVIGPAGDWGDDRPDGVGFG